MNNESTERLYSFIHQLKNNGVNSQQIFQSAQITGQWSDDVIATALYSLDRNEKEPRTQTKAEVASHENNNGVQSISILQTVFHHIALWFFIGATIPALITLVDLLTGGTTSPSTITTFLSVVIVTGGLYFVFYGIYLRKALKSKETIIPGKVFSIITMAFALVTLLIAAIAGLTVLVSSSFGGDSIGDSGTVLSSALTVVIAGAVIAIYWAATFLKTNNKTRKPLLIGSPIAIIAIITALFIAGFSTLPSVIADEKTRDALVETSEKIVNLTKLESSLPEDDTVLSLEDGMSYKKLDKNSYELCATFKNDSTNPYALGDTAALNDSYLSEYDFQNYSKGESCFTIESGVMEEINVLNLDVLRN